MASSFDDESGQPQRISTRLFWKSIEEERQFRTFFYSNIAPSSPLLDWAHTYSGARERTQLSVEEIHQPPDVFTMRGSDEPPLIHSVLQGPHTYPGGERSLDLQEHNYPGGSSGGGEKPSFGLPGLLQQDDDSAESSATKLFGLNQTKVRRLYLADNGYIGFATKFGRDMDVLEDAIELGARLLRQNGLTDLTWNVMQTNPDAASIAEVTTGLPISASFSEAAYEVWTNKMTLALSSARQKGLRFNLTFLTLGAGGARITTLAPDLISGCEEYEGDRYVHTVKDYTLQSGVVELPWDEGHVGQDIDGAYFPVEPSKTETGCACTTDNVGCLWHFTTLDVSSPYKRLAMGKIAELVGGYLTDIFNEFAKGGRSSNPADYIYNIEIFNEIEGLSVYAQDGGKKSETRDVEAGAEYWGRAFYRAAVPLREALDALGGTEVKIFLPAIASYGEGIGDTWDDKLLFLEGFLNGVYDEAVEVLNDVDRVLGQLPDLIQGIDYHWYHRFKTSNNEARHIGYLVLEVAELIETVQNHSFGQEEAFSIEGFVVSVMENGMSIEDQLTTPWKDKSAEERQAYDVWRRLGGALASSASVVGWHSWMSGSSSGFAQSGLRVDDGDDNAHPKEATQRPSWYAYSRMTQYLGDTVTAGKMVLPNVSSRDELDALINAVKKGKKNIAPEVVVFEYTRTSTNWPYAYLIVYDQDWDGADPTRTGFIKGLGIATILEADLSPNINTAPGATTTGGLPLVPAQWNSAALRISSTVPIHSLLNEPRLFLCSAKLSWSIVTA